MQLTPEDRHRIKLLCDDFFTPGREDDFLEGGTRLFKHVRDQHGDAAAVEWVRVLLADIRDETERRLRELTNA